MKKLQEEEDLFILWSKDEFKEALDDLNTDIEEEMIQNIKQFKEYEAKNLLDAMKNYLLIV